MCLIIVLFGILLNTIQDSTGERRITNGKPVQKFKTYAVYLLKAPASPQQYDAWLCGGAIVSPLYIVTSSACIEDVQFMYAIAGYNKYVNAASIDTDECTKNMKKKIVFTCIPKEYYLDYAKVEKWANIDIGVVKVESPFDFTDKSYETYCSYIPNEIAINYESKYQEPGIDAVVMGWGHSEIWRQPSDQTDHNEEQLNYAAIQITHKEVCKEAFDNIPAMGDIIDKYMICTDTAGNIDDAGELIVRSKPDANGCIMTSNGVQKLVDCETQRRYMPNTNSNITRRNGICQNDHGGPLVTWVGTHETLIGVASVFRVTDESKCAGPYLFTSTQCNGAFLDCIIHDETETRRNSICDKPAKERGFEFVRRKISWKNHPAGPADNEKISIRPQKPIRNG